MGLAELIRPELVFPDLPGSDRRSILRALSERIAAAGFIQTPATLYSRLAEREELGSTCVGRRVAIPHCKLEELDEVLVSVAISAEEIDFGGDDDEPVRLFFTVVSPEKAPAAHLQSLSLISRWIQTNSHVEKLIDQPNGQAILDFLASSENGEA